MFTGIIQHVGRLEADRPSGDGKRLTIDLGPVAEGLKPGDSVAIDGACLTVCGLTGGRGDFDVSGETLSRTTLGALRAGGKVNLERAMRLGEGLDGHLVQGHVDGVGRIRRIDRRPDQWTVEFEAPGELIGQMVRKGSVAVAGVSLTLTAVAEGTFAVALIPTTWNETTFAELAVGSKVNVETDVIGKYVRRYLQQLASTGGRDGGLTIEKLRDAGFA